MVPELMNYYSVNKSFTDGVSPEMKTGSFEIQLNGARNLELFRIPP